MTTESPSSTGAAAWYQPASDELRQGDICLGMLIARPGPVIEGRYALEQRTADVVVVTQSCDIPKKSQRQLLLAELHDFDRLVAGPGNDHLKDKDYLLALERGVAVSDFLLPPRAGSFGWSIVSFRDLYVLPKTVVAAELAAGSVVSLDTPYREFLSQAFARFVMRVGLPATLHGFAKSHA